MQAFQEVKREYQITLQVTSGYGAQEYIDSAYKKLDQAYRNLSPEEKCNVALPVKLQSTD